MSESAVSAKRNGVSLARNRRSPKRPSEPRPSGAHPEEGAVGQIAKLLANESGGGESGELLIGVWGGADGEAGSTQFARNCIRKRGE